MKKHTHKIHEDINEIDLKIIIPSAGLGRRMKSYGCKSLLTIKNKTLIDFQLNILSKTINSYEVILITGFDSDRLISATPENIIKIENEKYYETNVSRSINIGLRATKNSQHVLIIYGDLLFNEDAIRNIDFTKSCIVLSKYMNDNEVGCNINHMNNLEYMMFDLPNKWGQIVYLTGRELSIYKKIILNKQNDKKFGFEIINNVINSGGKFKCIADKDIKIMDIDTSKDLKKAQEFIK